MERLADSVVWFTDPECLEVSAAGGKGASLAAMTAAGLPVPPGFTVPADALALALEAAGHLVRVEAILAALRHGDDIASPATELQDLVHQSPPMGPLAEAVVAAYQSLDGGGDVAVRSSACAEDGDTASYAGQQETFLNVRGTENLLARITDCWASFFGERALFYRRAKGSVADLGMAVVVQRQLGAEKAGVMFTIDPVRRRRDQMVIEAAWGLGEAVVSGLVTPDQYIVSRDGAVKKSQVARQPVMIVRAPAGGTEQVDMDEDLAARPVLDDTELQSLAKLGVQSEEVFGGPQDVEWAVEGGQLYLLQSRPVTA